MSHPLLPPLVPIPGGPAVLGSPPGVGYHNERPRTVVLRPYALGRTPVTQAQWRAVTLAAQAAPWASDVPGLAGLDPAPSRFADGPDGPDRPVEHVSWLDAVAWCAALSRLAGLTPATRGHAAHATVDLGADGVRLPTEDEWEHAARAGTRTAWWTGDDPLDLSGTDWLARDSGGTPHPVGGRRPNPWGLYDIHGNVSEWCWDAAGWDYYADAHGRTDHLDGPPATSLRITRGGSAFSTPARSRSAFRNAAAWDDRLRNVGLRIAATLAPG